MGRGTPHIEDEGRDGHPFGVIDLWSDPGAWADALRFSVNIGVSDYEPAQAEVVSGEWRTLKREDVTPEFVRSIFDLRNSALYWRHRDDQFFANESFRTRYNNHVAGTRVAISVSRAGYPRLNIARSSFALHRIIWALAYGQWPNGDIDHINGDRGDCRLENLREATRSQNSRNRAVSSRSSSGVAGVTWKRDERKWWVRIRVNGLVQLDETRACFGEAIRLRRERERGLGFPCDFIGTNRPIAGLKCPLDAVEGRPDAPGAAVQSPFHSPTDTDERPQDHV